MIHLMLSLCILCKISRQDKAMVGINVQVTFFLWSYQRNFKCYIILCDHIWQKMRCLQVATQLSNDVIYWYGYLSVTFRALLDLEWGHLEVWVHSNYDIVDSLVHHPYMVTIVIDYQVSFYAWFIPSHVKHWPVTVGPLGEF